MIDFDNLDKDRIYLGLQYGKNSIIAKQIRKFSKCYAPNSKEIPTHALAFVYRFNGWWIYESHAKGYKEFGIPSGVRHYKLNTWKKVEENSLDEFRAFPLDINFEMLETLIGQPYGVGDIRSLLKAAIFKNNGKQKDRQGLICSEYIALCYPQICQHFLLPSYCITPAHFQNYLETKEVMCTEE